MNLTLYHVSGIAIGRGTIVSNFKTWESDCLSIMGYYLGQKELPRKKLSYFHIIVLADGQLC